MSESFDDFIEIRDTNGFPVIRADANSGEISVGRGGISGGTSGNLVLRNSLGQPRINLISEVPPFILPHANVYIDGTNNRLSLGSETGVRVALNGTNATIEVGGDGVDGDLFVDNDVGEHRIHLDASGGTPSPTTRVHVDGSNGEIRVGGDGISGDLFVANDEGQNRIHLDVGGAGDTSSSTRVHVDGTNGEVRVGGDGIDGGLLVNNLDGENRIHLDVGSEANVSTTTRVYINGTSGNIRLGGNDSDGDLWLFPSSATDILDASQATIYLDGGRGDIILQNADCAEDFMIENIECAEPGTVMIIGEDSRLRISQTAYDRRVAGVVAGAGTCRPGIVLGRKNDVPDALPIALVGRTFCKVDADHGAVDIGDLLTTSSTPGHAMKAGDPANAFGAVIGKALGTLRSGKGLLPILIALQ